MATTGQEEKDKKTGGLYYPEFFKIKTTNSFTKVATLTSWLYYQ